MRLVVDTNILFSLFKNSDSFKKFIKDNNLELYAPRKMFEELNKYSERICLISGLTLKDFSKIIDELPKIISFYEVDKKEVKEILPYIEDPKDSPFIALALKLNIPVWSEDRHFKKQNLVASYTFKELKEHLKDQQHG